MCVCALGVRMIMWVSVRCVTRRRPQPKKKKPLFELGFVFLCIEIRDYLSHIVSIYVKNVEVCNNLQLTLSLRLLLCLCMVIPVYVGVFCVRACVFLSSFASIFMMTSFITKQCGCLKLKNKVFWVLDILRYLP